MFSGLLTKFLPFSKTSIMWAALAIIATFSVLFAVLDIAAAKEHVSFSERVLNAWRHEFGAPGAWQRWCVIVGLAIACAWFPGFLAGHLTQFGQPLPGGKPEPASDGAVMTLCFFIYGVSWALGHYWPNG